MNEDDSLAHGADNVEKQVTQVQNIKYRSDPGKDIEGK